MDDVKGYSIGGIGFLALLFILLIALFNNRGGWNGFGGFANGFGWGNGFGFGGWNGVGVPGYGLGFEDYKAICNSEKQEIINSARTQYLIEQQGSETRAVATANAATTNAKIDFYAYQAERDKVADLQRQVSELRGQQFTTASLAPIKEALADLQCNTLRRPPVYGNSSSCNRIDTPNYWNNFGCGCNGNVLA